MDDDNDAKTDGFMENKNGREERVCVGVGEGVCGKGVGKEWEGVCVQSPVWEQWCEVVVCEVV